MVTRLKIGILGGLGPLASAQFVNTIYRECLVKSTTEQELPQVILHSMPNIEDRTQALLSGNARRLAATLENALETLQHEKCDVIIICCFTMHSVLHLVDKKRQTELLSLTSIVTDSLTSLEGEGSPLLLATKGSYQANIFGTDPYKENCDKRIIPLKEPDIQVVHEGIYRLKRGGSPTEMIPIISGLSVQYGTNKFLFGCTELHLLSNQMENSSFRGHWVAIDPLSILAKSISRYSKDLGLLSVLAKERTMRMQPLLCPRT